MCRADACPPYLAHACGCTASDYVLTLEFLFRYIRENVFEKDEGRSRLLHLLGHPPSMNILVREQGGSSPPSSESRGATGRAGGGSGPVRRASSPSDSPAREKTKTSSEQEATLVSIQEEQQVLFCNSPSIPCHMSHEAHYPTLCGFPFSSGFPLFVVGHHVLSISAGRSTLSSRFRFHMYCHFGDAHVGGFGDDRVHSDCGIVLISAPHPTVTGTAPPTLESIETQCQDPSACSALREDFAALEVLFLALQGEDGKSMGVEGERQLLRVLRIFLKLLQSPPLSGHKEGDVLLRYLPHLFHLVMERIPGISSSLS